jgi:metallo-beta-lactamase family protein
MASTIQRRGKVIIPAFAVGRTQEIVFFLNQLISARVIPAIPVYVDSPLAVEASKIFRSHPEYFDAETREFIREAKHPALDFKGLTYVASVDESKRLNDMDESMVIISASGMAEAGRILHHLRNNVENPRNTILIVGWQAPHTLGRRLAEEQKQVRIFGQLFDVRAEIRKITGLSAHAGQDLLLKYALAVKDRVKKVYLVHGEPEVANIFQEKLKSNGMHQVEYPEWNEVVEF